jgi:hypothetical protein
MMPYSHPHKMFLLLLSISAHRHFIDDYVPCMRGVKKNYDNVQIKVITIYSGAVWFSYKYSFYPKTIVQWNLLPAAAVQCPTLDSFKEQTDTTICSPTHLIISQLYIVLTSSVSMFVTELVLWNLLQVYLAALRWAISSLLMLYLV